MKILVTALVAAATVVGGGPRAFAQTYQGAVRGSVLDANGVVPAAEVALFEENTSLTRTTVTNAHGEYVFSNVLPGVYALEATAPGFKTYRRSELPIGTHTFLTIDIRLEVGIVTEHITVNAEASLVESSTASVSTMIDRTALDTLPSAGRNVFFLSVTAPTVVATGDSQFVRQQDQSNSSLISIAGGPRRDNSYVLEGVPIVDILNRASFIPSFQAVEEMRLQISAYDAEIGRTSGGVFNTTGRSGSNAWRGSAHYQNRPDWGMGRLFFAKKNDIPNPDTYYHLYGGAAGGPIRRNRTFFWASTENYRTATARNTVLVLSTEAERRGDFSQSGVTIYDPLTTRPDPNNPAQFIRNPFPNNQIPADRLHPVALALLDYVPLPTSGKLRPAVAQIQDRADQITGKITHRWSDRLTSTGMYAWYTSMEPDARFYGRPLFENGADPGDGALVRAVHLVAINTIWVPTNQTVIAVRYGYNQFLDDNRPAPFDPTPLGFDPGFLGLVPLKKFPGIGVTDYGRGGTLLGDRSQEKATYYSHIVNASVSRLVGRQTLKIGGDYRVTGVRFRNIGGTGSYGFSRDFTFGPNPNAPAPGTGDAFASFLLGYPAGGGISLGTPIDIYLNYWSAFLQNDIRLTSKLTLNAGIRYEFEQGLQERQDRMIVGWAFDQPFPMQVGGTRPDGTPLALTGGLLYAGVGGATTHQGDPNPTQFAPRVGLAYAADVRTVVRGGYGLFWAPAQGISANEGGSGTRGYNESTSYVATLGDPFIPCPACSLTNPFANGLRQPSGNSLGRLTGVGGSVDFVDPDARMGHMHRYSIDLRRELPNQIAVAVGYLGARGENLAVAGAQGGGINLNQLDPKYFALGTALQQSVPNPFFGTPLGVGILAGPTVPRGQLLRPYPQFDTVAMTRPTRARSRYHAIVLEGERRLSDGWAVRGNYTWSRLKDNLFGESNFFAGGSGLLNNYDTDAEYGLSVLDTPHRLNVTGILELPFGNGRRWLNRGGLVHAVLGGWSVVAVATYQSGFPITVAQSPNNSNLFGSGQRPNIVPGVDPRLTNDPEGSYDPACGCIRWLNPAAWSQAAPFTFGNAPRADGRARTPVRRNWDLAVEKSQRAGGTTISVRAEVINLFDFADLRGPSVAFGDASFGQIREAAGFPQMVQILVRAAW